MMGQSHKGSNASRVYSYIAQRTEGIENNHWERCFRLISLRTKRMVSETFKKKKKNEAEARGIGQCGGK